MQPNKISEFVRDLPEASLDGNTRSMSPNRGVPYRPRKSLYVPFCMEDFLKKHGFSGDAAAYLREAAEAPSRSPNGYFSNTYRYPCPINGHTLTGESNWEFAAILTVTRQPGVLRVFEQGPRRVIRTTTKAGAPYSFSCTIDAAVVHESGLVEVIEVMTTDDAAMECLKNPNRFQDVGNGEYVSAPAAEYFGKMGFKHRIVLSRNLSPSFVQWADFLRPYCLGHSPTPITQDEANQIIAAVHEEPGIFMEDLDMPQPRRAEVVYHMLAKGDIFTHYSVGHPTKQHEIRLYPTALKEQAFDLLRQTARVAPKDLNDLNHRVQVGTIIEIKGKEYTVEKLSRAHLTLQCAKTGDEHKVSFQALLDLKPLIGRIYFAEKIYEAKINEASPEDLLTMLSRHATLQQCDQDQTGSLENRTIRRWRERVKEYDAIGLGIEGLLPGHGGNSIPRIDDKVYKLLKALLTRYYMAIGSGETAVWIYRRLFAINARFRLGGTPSQRTVNRHCAALDPYKKAMARGGKRYATRFRPVYPANLTLGNPAGQTAWQRAHADSTAVDLLNVADGTTERLHIIKLVESFSGGVLCHHISKIAPSEETVRELCNLCVERHHMLPSTITFDWGPEGRSTWIQTTLEKLGVTLIFRPKATPGSGANIESLWRKLCLDLLHNLRGSTKLLQKARMVTLAVNPHNRAVWTEAGIRELIEEYYSLINELPRRGRRAPNTVMMECVAKFGPPPTQIPDVEAFHRLLLPLVEGVTRTVSPRGMVRHREHSYYHNDLRQHAGKELVTRFDPGVIKKVWVTLPNERNRQVECEVVDSTLKYADEKDAMAHHTLVRDDAKAQRPEAERRWAGFVTKVGRKQKSMVAQKAAAERQPRKPKPAAAPPASPTPTVSNVIPMPLTFKKLVSS